MKRITSFDLFKYFLFVGATCFGGPLAIIDKIRQDLVYKRKWLSQDEFNDYFGYAQIAPGPLAYQVAIYIGYYKSGFFGALLSGIGLVLPSYLVVLVFSIFYIQYKDAEYIRFALYGFSPLIIAIIVKSGFNLSKSFFNKDYFLYLLFLLSIILTIFYKILIIYLIIGSAIISLVYYMIVNNKKKINSFNVFSLNIIYKSIILFVSFFILIKEFFSSKLFDIAFLFLKVGALTYGSGFVIVGVLRQEVVDNLKWLSSKEFIDGIAFGQITPGPVVITSTFIGYLTSGFIGSIVSTTCIFLPTFIFVLVLAQKIEKFKNNFYLKSLIKGANAAALGAILATAYMLSRDAIFDITTLIIFITSAAVLFFTNVKEYYLIILSILLGLFIKIFLF